MNATLRWRNFSTYGKVIFPLTTPPNVLHGVGIEKETDMTVAKTIAMAEAHAKNGNVEGALRIIDAAIRAAGSGVSMFRLSVAKHQITDPTFDKLVKQKQAGK